MGILSHKFEKTRGIHLALKHFFVVDIGNKSIQASQQNSFPYLKSFKLIKRQKID